MRVFALFIRDLKKLMRNPLVMVSSILLPLIYLFIVGQSITGVIKNLPVGVFDADGGSVAHDLMEKLLSLEGGPHLIKIVPIHDPAEGKRRVMRGELVGMITIPPNTTKRFLSGRGAEVDLLLDNADPFSSNALHSSLESLMPALTLHTTGGELLPPGAQVRTQNLFRKVDSDVSLLPGILVMAIFMGTLISGAFNLVMDRFLGTIEGYLVTPVKRWEIVLGLTLSGTLVTTIIAFTILALGLVLTDLTIRGGWITFFHVFITVVLSSLVLLSLMFTILGRADHPRIIGILGGFLNVIFFFPSGAVYPIYSFPHPLQVFARYNPETYAVKAFRILLFKGPYLDLILPCYGNLLAFLLIFMVLAHFSFKRTL